MSARPRPATSSARITPRLPARRSGLTTHGKSMRVAICSGSSSSRTLVNIGTGSPARATGLALGELVARGGQGRDRVVRQAQGSAENVAARTVVSSSAPTTAASGYTRENSATCSAGLSGPGEVERDHTLGRPLGPHQRPIRAHRRVDAQPPARLDQRFSAPRGGGQQQQHAGHRSGLGLGIRRVRGAGYFLDCA